MHSLLLWLPLLALTAAPERPDQRRTRAPAPRCACQRQGGDALLAAVQRCYARRPLQARFQQTYVDAALGPRPSEVGQLAVDADGRMRFAYEQPEAKVFVFDGNSAAMVEPRARQVTVLEGFQRSQSGLALAFLSGAAIAPGVFHLTEEPKTDSRAEATLAFVPAQGGASWREAAVAIERATCEIVQVRFTDLAGNTTRYELTARRLGAPVDPALFIRAWPADYSVLKTELEVQGR